MVLCQEGIKKRSVGTIQSFFPKKTDRNTVFCGPCARKSQKTGILARFFVKTVPGESKTENLVILPLKIRFLSLKLVINGFNRAQNAKNKTSCHFAKIIVNLCTNILRIMIYFTRMSLSKDYRMICGLMFIDR